MSNPQIAIVTHAGIDDHEGMILSHAGGGLAMLHVSLRTRASPDMTLLGSNGRIHAGQRESAVMPLRDTLQIMETLDRIRAQLGVTYPGE